MPLTRTVLLASPRSFCAGVERAIDVVERELAEHQRVHVRRQIVHNTHVVAGLEAQGAVFVDEIAQIPVGSTVVFAAHGVAPVIWQQAADRQLRVIDATCPLVAKVHVEARRFAAQGDTVVVIGHAGHEEIEGVLGEIPEAALLVETVAEVARLTVPDPDRVSYLTQTTLAVDETADIVAALVARFPAIRGPGSADICYATTNRQEALASITDDADVVLVVGSANSSNSVRLVEFARRRGVPAYLLEDAEQLQDSWIQSATVIGLTAGASAPPPLVDAVIAALRRFGPVVVTERVVARETVQFRRPGVDPGSEMSEN
jgi:4-hydroxy-3-methylbut-2-enyl diphosphate reductase